MHLFGFLFTSFSVASGRIAPVENTETEEPATEAYIIEQDNIDPPPTDSDLDGLSDAEEDYPGTAPNNTDTDDGSTDEEEENIASAIDNDTGIIIQFFQRRKIAALCNGYRDPIARYVAFPI